MSIPSTPENKGEQQVALEEFLVPLVLCALYSGGVSCASCTGEMAPVRMPVGRDGEAHNRPEELVGYTRISYLKSSPNIILILVSCSSAFVL